MSGGGGLGGHRAAFSFSPPRCLYLFFGFRTKRGAEPGGERSASCPRPHPHGGHGGSRGPVPQRGLGAPHGADGAHREPPTRCPRPEVCVQRCAQHIAAGTHAHGRTARWVRARPRCRKESCGVGAAPRCAQLRGLAPHRRFPQHKAPRSGADRGQTLAEALRERARGRAVSALSSASLFLPISFFSSCCLLNFLLSLFSFTSYLFLLAFSGASFLALPFSFPLFSFSYSFSYSFLLIHPSFRFHSSVVFPVCFSVSFFSHNFYLPFSFRPFPLSSFASFSFSFIFISFIFFFFYLHSFLSFSSLFRLV